MHVARSWSARASAEGARAYVAWFRHTLAPELDAIAGHLGAWVLERPRDDLVEITVVTFWDSLDAVKRFAGPSHERAVIEPEARALLVSCDDHVEHRTVALETRSR